MRLLFPRKVTKSDLQIPDTYCSPNKSDTAGYKCPDGLECIKVDMPSVVMGFNGFDELREYTGICNI